MATENSIESATTRVTGIGAALAAEFAAKPHLEAVIDLESEFTEMHCVFQAFDEAAGDNSPAWLAVTWAAFRRLETAMDRVSLQVRSVVDDGQ